MTLLAFEWNMVVDPFLRWCHMMAAIVWVGMLYFFNFINVPMQAALTDDTRKQLGPQLMPRCLWWFRWGAMATFLFGLLLFAWKYLVEGYLTSTGFDGSETLSDRALWALWGMLLGTIMWFNVWFIIWPAQKAMLAAAKAGQPVPEGLPGRVKLFSRMGTILSGPMLFAMIFAAHFSTMDAVPFALSQVLGVVTGFALIWTSDRVGRSV